MRKIRKIGCGLILLLLGIVGIVGVYIATQIYILPGTTEVSPTLRQLYVEDQEIRLAGVETPADIIVFYVGDWIRVNKVRQIVAADLLTTAQDYANAARILQHGDKATDYQKAQELSIKAFELGEEDMLRHSGLAEDRYLLAIGKAQKYGTQFFCEPERGWQLYPVDTTVTDEERAQLSIEPLAEMELKIEKLNQETEGECLLTQETMRIVEAIMEGTQ
jgi:hypothetical protein